jgi:transcriptional regulator with XRE-family HTH domain
MEDMIMYEKEKLDLTAFRQAVKEARESKSLSREQLAEMLDLSPRHVQYIETRGQHPSIQKLYEIAMLFNISIDQFFFPDTSGSKNTSRRQLDAMIDSMDERDFSIITATARAMHKAKKQGE